MTSRTYRAAGLVLLAFLAFVAGAPALAQNAEDAMNRGRDLYRDKNYSAAVTAYTQAIQVDPSGALRAYRNIARSYNKLGELVLAEQYYVWFLELAPEDEKNRKKITLELKEVRKKIKKKKIQRPDSILTNSQSAALKQLESKLEHGPFMAGDGSGCMALYDVLLRTQYATPNLAGLRERLARGLLGEARVAVRPVKGQAAPALDREAWALVRDRVAQASLLRGESELDTLGQGLNDLSHGWEQYAMSNYDRAREHFTLAVEADDTLLAGHWGLAMATFLTDQGDFRQTLAALDAAEAAFVTKKRSASPFVPIMRAMVLQSLKKHDEAAAIFRNLTP